VGFAATLHDDRLVILHSLPHQFTKMGTGFGRTHPSIHPDPPINRSISRLIEILHPANGKAK
jgi:hypothetical protein